MQVAEQERRDRSRQVLLGAGIAVLAAAVIAGGFWATRGTTPAAAPTTLKVRADTPALIVGNKPDAPLKVVVYEDFLCPYCRRFETQTRGFLQADAAEGKVLVEYRPFKLLPENYSVLALNAWGQVLAHGTPKQALAFHDALYDQQPAEKAADTKSLDDLVKVARGAGVPTSVTEHFGDADNTFLAAAQHAATTAKVTSTPTVYVNGKELPGASIDDLVAALQRQIERSGS